MSFVDDLKNDEHVLTENGAIAYKTSGSYLVDLNFRIPSFRNKVDTSLFDLALAEDERHTLKWLLYLRDIRGGMGERKSFRELLVHLSNTKEDLCLKLLDNVDIAEYGRYDDLVYVIHNTKSNAVKRNCVVTISRQLSNDIASEKQGKPCSLLAKWLPSENASSRKTKLMAREIRKELFLSSKDYRKILAKLRKHIDVVEVKMSSNNWDSINYSSVPSKANIRYYNAFMNHDYERFYNYVSAVTDGLEHINASALYLYDIINKYRNHGWYSSTKDYDVVLEQLWKAQPNVDGFSDTLVMRDGSGSMTIRVSSSGVTASDVCDSLTLYASEHNVGEYANKFITFGSNPSFVDLSGCTTLHDKLVTLAKYTDCSSTNIKKAFQMVLHTAINHHTRKEDMPKRILIISDMEFDAYGCIDDSDVSATLFERISRAYNKYGYTMPKLVFWNVNSRTNSIPVHKTDAGIILVSGFSRNIMDMVLSDEITPLKALLSILDTKRYQAIDKIYE